MSTKIAGAAILVVTLAVIAGTFTVRADEFTKEDLERWHP
jgi:hypothetical protein